MVTGTHKRVYSAGALVLALMFVVALCAAPASATLEYGDVNRDGTIDVNDAVMVMRYVLGLRELSDLERLLADVNGDGQINVQDVSLLMRRSLGLIGDFGDLPPLAGGLVDSFITAEGIVPGRKLVVVTLVVADPESYEVSVAGTALVYRQAVEGFVGEVDEEDALREKVRVSPRS